MSVIYQKPLHRFAIFTAAATVVLIVAGATVTSTQSGDAVPDWPLSYGSLNPPMKGGILYEHSHRLIAGFTGLLIAVLAFWLLRRESRPVVRWMGVAALIAVVIQAVLGGLRVLVVSTESVQDVAAQLAGPANLEPARIAIAVVHASLAQSILCLIFAIVVMTSRTWVGDRPETAASRNRLPRAGLVLVAAVFIQLVLGALIRHTNAGLIIPDFPLSFGHILPPFGNLPSNPRAPFPVTGAELTFKVALQFAHRVLAAVILALVITLFIRMRSRVHLGRMLPLLLALTILQVCLGAMNIWTGKSVFTTIPHVAVGALILATSVVTMIRARGSRQMGSQA